ncbi:protein artemis [Nasonia vitripennis]|uniref:Protein artemis n=1 Tax=Nasonia vitripennis TaxID=7425 RepID=A0A7M7GGN0_NASVI|nr:protein artemis [Nasonia vitripennis]
MSTFLGLIEEIPGISIDRFDGDNLNSSAFFLSHGHTDHMKGLNYDFFHFLKRKDSFLYCSHITKLIVENKFPKFDRCIIEKHLIQINIDELNVINYVHCGTQVSITVTCVPSGHCPGSVMFLLNFGDKRILYTGDFRISIEDISKLKSLHYTTNSQRLPLQIDKIYLDTTFLDVDFQILPSRLDSLKKLAAVVKEWVEKDPKNVVLIEFSAKYGSEFLYMELSKMLNKRIHVKDDLYRVYSRLDILANHVTDIAESTSIHACMDKNASKKKKGLQCRPDVVQNNILTIIPSVMKWAGKDTSCIIEHDSIEAQTINVCYSTHASYREIEAFIQYFKPTEVFACVDKDGIDDLLRNIMQNKKRDKFPAGVKKLKFSNYKTFNNVSNFKPTLISDDEDE